MPGWQVVSPGPDVRRAVRRTSMEPPRPGPGELLVEVDACGVCRGADSAQRHLEHPRGRPGLLDFAAEHRLRVTVTPYQMARADEALADLAAGRVTGAAVLVP